ncbi:MFS transporter [Leifsonia virtsii]|uniref:MFS transporter n=1 Tax=Leifsonia virtsii TaxID=3035915 RepID=A0ABT8J1V1_9MICO|nr:MFS transporter [Leifsonia virtsii]MDN4598591.1 MFS transporter [Leifsonia virtsii]
MTAIAAPVRTAWSARGWAIYLGWIVITLDGSALNLALPRIADDLNAQAGGISWVVDAYTLPLASLLLLGGSLGDRVGAERLFRVGAIGFAAASAACALSPSIGVLIACRAAQGVFAALLLPMVLALVGKSFDDPGHRSTAVNMMTVFGGAGMAVGPFLGGLLTDTAGWRAVFWLTAPIAIAAAALVGRADHPRARRDRPRLDLAGQLIGTAGLVAVVAGLIEAGRDASAPLTWILLLGGVLLLAVFVLVEHRAKAPIMPLGVFRSPGFAGAVVGGFAFQFGAYGLQFFLALYIQTAWGVSALTGGLLLGSFALGTILAGVLVNPALLRRGNRRMILIGSGAAAAGTLMLLGALGVQQWWVLVTAEFVVGAGTAIYSTALNRTASVSLGAESAGLASGIYNTSRQVGQAVGIAVLGALAALADARVGYVAAVLVITCCTAVIAGTALRARASEAAQAV